MPRYARVLPTHRVPPDPGGLDLLLFQQRQVISRRQALRYLSEAAIRHRLESGRWRLAERAVYVTHTGPVSARQQLVIGCLAAGAGRPAVLGGLSALIQMGLRGWRRAQVHVLLPWQRRDLNPPPWVVVHRTRRLGPDELRAVGSPPHTLEVRSVVDAAQWAVTDPAGGRDRDRRLPAAAGDRRRGGAGGGRTAAGASPAADPGHRADAAGGSHSLPEIDFLRHCRRAGLPAPTRQVVRPDGSGRRRYLDAYFEEYGVQVEIDGGQHTEVRRWWADTRRQNDLWVAGDRVLRFPTFVIRAKPDEWLPHQTHPQTPQSPGPARPASAAGEGDGLLRGTGG